VVIKGDHFVLKEGDKQNEATLKLETAQSPRRIDLVVKAGEKTEVFRGVYQFDGDDLQICATAEPGKDRPTGFATKDVPGVGLMTLRRVKP
jgi:uncharacterized protein (TIGR03067 family)